MSVQKSPSSINGQTMSPNSENQKSPSLDHYTGNFSTNSLNKQISKLKRFLSTILSFGKEIDSNTGEIVRNLVFGLLCNRINVEQFQTKLQQATHFPLKTFVTPFIKATLPLLQQEIILCSQLVHQTPENFLLHNKEYLSATDCQKNDLSSETTKAAFCFETLNKDSKDSDLPKSPESSCDTSKKANKPFIKRTMSMKNELDPVDLVTKDVLFGSSVQPNFSSWRQPLVTVSNVSERLESISQNCSNNSSSTTLWGNSQQASSLLDSQSVPRQSAFFDKLHKQWDQLLAHISNFPTPLPIRGGLYQYTSTEYEIISGIDEIIKTQEDNNKNIIQLLRNVQESIKKYKEDTKLSELLHGNSNSNSIDIASIKRRASKHYDEAVQEVQRVAQMELRRIVRSLQERTIELVEQEKARYQFVLEDVRRQCKDEYTKLLLRQEEGPENCKNCGRKASEACSGCQTARYCGRFCQQKDWSKHKNECGQYSASSNKKAKLENIEPQLSPPKSPPQNDPENLSLKSNNIVPLDMNGSTNSISIPSDGSPMLNTCLLSKRLNEHNSSEENVLVDV